MLTIILITIFATLFATGTINFIAIYLCNVDPMHESFAKWNIGLGWFWFWSINLLFALPIAIYGWFKYGIAIGVKSSPAHYFVYCRNPLKFFSVRRALKRKGWYYWTKTYFPVGNKTNLKADYNFFCDVKKHQKVDSHILYV